MSDEIEYEPIPGVPGALPAGEELLWQGSPQWKSMARETFKVGWLAVYFTIFGVARLVLMLQQGESLGSALLVFPLAAVCLGLLTLLAYVNARASRYTITSKRLVLRIGVALPMSINLPFEELAAADVTLRKAGDGDVVLQLKGPNRIAWLHLWPHVQPWHFSKARPTLQSLAEPKVAAAVLAEAVKAWAATRGASIKVGLAEGDTVPVAVGAATHSVTNALAR